MGMATVKPVVSSGNHLVYTNQAPILIPIAGGAATTLGRGMAPNFHAPLIPEPRFQARGVGQFNLTETVPATDPRFPRGPRLSGRQGTIDLWFTTPTAGTARTLCYLTDAPQSVGNVIALRVDTSNRPLVTLTETGGATPAQGTLTDSDNFANTETVTIDGKVYTFQTVLTNVDGNVFIGVGLVDSLLNLLRAINLGAGSGSLYAAATTLHATVSAIASDATTMTVQAKVGGPGGDAITTTTDGANASWGGATLSGGSVGTTTVGETTPAGATLPDATVTHVRLAWDSLNLVDGVRHASLVVGNDAIPGSDWSTDPTAPWLHFQPTHLVVGQAFDTDSDLGGPAMVQAIQASNLVTL